MATVLVDGRERNIRLTSIQKMGSEGDITISRAEYDALKEDIATLTTELKKLQLKIDKMDKK